MMMRGEREREAKIIIKKVKNASSDGCSLVGNKTSLKSVNVK